MNNKGQVTIFIILGIIIVIAALTASFLRDQSLTDIVQGIAFRSVVVPEQAQGVVNYVNNCIEDITKEGIDIMGLQGGYITIPREIDVNPRAYLPFTDNIKIPYWIYGQNIRNIPDINDMERDLENFIETRFDEDCGLGVYDDLGYDVPSGSISVDVVIGVETVDVRLSSGLKVGIKEDEYNLDEFIFVSLSSRLSEFYEMAIEIVNRETRSIDGKVAPLEFNTMNMIALWSRDEDVIPSISKFDFSCKPATYFLTDVANELSRRISDMTSRLQIDGTNLQTFDDAFYDSMLMEDVFTRDHGDVDLQFNFYEGWPFLLDITPRNGPILKSSVLKIGLPLLPKICFNSHDFRYDLVYPVTIDLEADGELFRFPIEIFIDSNYGRRNLFGRETRLHTPSKFCEETQKISEEIVVKAFDNSDGEELEDVRVLYTCGLNECVMGNIGENDLGVLEYRSRFPNCVGGEVQLTKEGYGIFRESLDTLESGAQSISAVMEPFRELKLDFNVVELDSNDGILGNRDVKSSENVILQLNRINEDFGGFDETIVINFNYLDDVSLSLVPGRYNVVIDLVLTEETLLQGQNINGLDVESQTVDNLVLGHAEFEHDITNGDLLNENIKFNIFGIQPLLVEDILRGYEMSEIVERNREVLDLEFS